ncbi:Histone-lysine N-methyltransferase [Phytophthora nicotianae]|uniref:Histone-lysine N-methyltransferase n=1 Tax=Phytophthora nicotianae TaxID=4792 RepID=A0A0W8DDN6_PHYNI|nr:Histone-lysine N-methyltransferase [Phytophthora nicotianae]
MSLTDLAPANTKRARESASRSFKAFLNEEGVPWEYLEVCMKRDNAATMLEAVVDMHLAFKKGRNDQLLARHSVMQYFRQGKNWLLEQFPLLRPETEKNLLKKGQVLERYCMKRETGTFVNKAPACTKEALKKMTTYLYSTTATASDYQDATILCLLWFLFGRASDLTLLRKENLSIGSGNIFFVRFIRVKTSEEQGLSRFPDEDFTTCPLLAIALSLAMQSAPTASLLSQLPEQHTVSRAALTPTAPLIDLMDHPGVVAPLQPSSENAKSTEDAPGIHSHVNRVLGKVAEKAGVTEHFTSHSFRRGGAQHANGTGMYVQWIFGRGAWNMTSTNKVFAYVFNTPAEDHKVARVLSNRDPEETVKLLDLDSFDSTTKVNIRYVCSVLFTASSGLASEQHNVNARVLDTLMTYLIRHYPALKALAAGSPAIQRLEACAIERGFSVNDLLAWSSYLASVSSSKSDISVAQDTTADVTKHPVFLHQTALIEQLIQVNKTLDARLSVMEAKICNKHTRTPAPQQPSVCTNSEQPHK